MSKLRDLFIRNLAQTSDAPIGLEIVRAEGAWLYTADGRRYLDFIAGIGVSALGHGHPAIVEAVSKQVATLAHTSNLFLHERQVELAERLRVSSGSAPLRRRGRRSLWAWRA